MAEIPLMDKAMNSGKHSVGRTEYKPKLAFSLTVPTLDIQDFPKTFLIIEQSKTTVVFSAVEV